MELQTQNHKTSLNNRLQLSANTLAKRLKLKSKMLTLSDKRKDIPDGLWAKCDECGGPVKAIPLLTSDRIANKSKDPSYSPHGYTVMEDGTIYTLTKQWTHGTLLAILFPDMAKKAGYEPPDEDFNVFKY